MGDFPKKYLHYLSDIRISVGDFTKKYLQYLSDIRIYVSDLSKKYLNICRISGYDKVSDVPESGVRWRADFQSGF